MYNPNLKLEALQCMRTAESMTAEWPLAAAAEFIGVEQSDYHFSTHYHKVVVKMALMLAREMRVQWVQESGK